MRWALGFCFTVRRNACLGGTDAIFGPFGTCKLGLIHLRLVETVFSARCLQYSFFAWRRGIFTIDPTRPYFSGCMVNVVILIALAVFSFVSAIGGWQRLMKPQRGVWQT